MSAAAALAARVDCDVDPDLDGAWWLADGRAVRRPGGYADGQPRQDGGMTLASGVGSHPGDDQRDFDEAVRLVLGELPDLPYLPEVPGRGPPRP